MKQFLWLALVMFFSIPAYSQQKIEMSWYGAAQFGIEGKGWPDSATKTPFYRLPAKAETMVNKDVWQRGSNSAGLHVTFTTDASLIAVRWRLSNPSFYTPSLSSLSVAGMDMYMREADKWVWAAAKPPNPVRPPGQEGIFLPDTTTTFVRNLSKELRDFRIYFPIYNGVDLVEIGIPVGSRIGKPKPDGKKPIVIYGSSIIQGSAASRPGMTLVSQLNRRLGREVINLGFAGLCKMEPEMAQLLAELDPDLYVIDCLPNMSAAEITERTFDFVKTISTARPNTPILIVENPNYAQELWNPGTLNAIRVKNARLLKEFTRLEQAGIKNLHYFKGSNSYGDGGDATFDGVHPTDLGFKYYANALEPAIRGLLDR